MANNPKDQNTDVARDYYSKENILYVAADKASKDVDTQRAKPLRTGAKDVEIDRSNDFAATVTGRYGRTAKDFKED